MSNQRHDRPRTRPDRERDDLMLNLVTELSQCEKRIREKMVWHLIQSDEDFSRRVANGLDLSTVG